MGERFEIVPGRGRVRVDNNPFIAITDNREYRPRESAYERTKRQVYATGNKWAIENFHATHD